MDPHQWQGCHQPGARFITTPKPGRGPYLGKSGPTGSPSSTGTSADGPMVAASTSTQSGGNAAGRSYDSLTVAATQCGSYDYAGMADYYDSYVSVCRSSSGYLYRAHLRDGDLELPATKVGPGQYLVDADPHMISVHEGIVTVTDSNGDTVRTVPLYDWKYEY